MPLLDSIDITSMSNIQVGVPWDGIRALLSVPRIRHFSLRFCPDRGCPFPCEEDFAFSPLESFEYVLSNYIHLQRYYIGEATFLQFVLQHSNTSLKHLRLPLGIAPVSLISSLYWPQLRRLYLKGEEAVHSRALPICSLIAHMPKLRSLTFLPALLRHSRRTIGLDPSLFSGEPFPCPELEELTVAHPDPNDAFYAHLPPTLRRLTLQCWPRHCIHRNKLSGGRMDQIGWRSPILSSSELLSLLEKTRLPELELLDLEYVADAREETLLHRLPLLYPALEMLTIYRYRGADTDEVPVTWLGRQHSSHDRLRMLRIHFDFPQSVDPQDDQLQLLQSAAMEVARHITSPAIHYVCALQREGLKNVWLPWRVDHDRNGAVRWTLDTTLTAFRGVSMSDDDGPFVFIDPEYSESDFL
ncbi:hypothetical protein FKP32DRAFT_1155770 [Trametes sanguinea]|nr:hypothetical protein FKP32DRAFT_1155770 [Trametes sanguinea]